MRKLGNNKDIDEVFKDQNQSNILKLQISEF